ncbi:Leucine Rich Repeat [Seminavis robusta]|uniref:Leucine Rich Repeat n=1 Tax=Seminavis robusta TaxID=568900 RepID=A0A9N8DSB1_9STRA|nr:Leucine Rich Repeat [Seminavis robusta]|eukprot:Sro320_g116560.1 Leucine Rich Repeat (747) ;mRNA; r:53974-56300
MEATANGTAIGPTGVSAKKPPLMAGVVCGESFNGTEEAAKEVARRRQEQALAKKKEFSFVTDRKEATEHQATSRASTTGASLNNGGSINTNRVDDRQLKETAAKKGHSATRTGDDDIPSPPTLFPGRTIRTSFPGAYANHGSVEQSRYTNGGVTTPEEESVPWDITGRIQPEGVEAGVTRDNEGLVVANLVVEDENLQTALPQAAPETYSIAVSREHKRVRRLRAGILLGVVFAMVMIMILVAMFIPSKLSSDANAATGLEKEDDLSDIQTQMPTSVPNYILSLIPTALTVRKILQEPDSPQARAFAWLLEEGNVILSQMSDARIKQKLALATLYFATGGETWDNNEKWLNHSIHECEWYNKPDVANTNVLSKVMSGYLAGFAEPLAAAQPCDSYGFYQHLWLDQNNLDGAVPLELAMLTTLKTLSLGWNPKLGGTMDSHIGQLTALEGLFLNRNDLSGMIPSEIGLLSNLHVVSLGGNNLEGYIPEELWRLTKLVAFIVGRSKELQGSIPSEVGLLTKLRQLYMQESDFTGSIPTEIGRSTSLESLMLFVNRFSGTLPSEFGLLSKLTMMSSFDNSIQGTIPTAFGKLSNLTQFSIKINQLTGPVPSELGLLTNLAYTCNLRFNQLTGSIPTEFGLLTHLRELEFSHNLLSGQIPLELGSLAAMGKLTFANNSLSGIIPQELFALQQSLHTLALEGNPQLSGSVPDRICAINGTCIGSYVDPCVGPYGLSFDCTDLLCGCNCACA